MKIKQFIMIREFVPVKESVTDFCCILNFMGMEVPNSVLKYCLASHIHDSKTKCCKFYHERVEERMTEFLMPWFLVQIIGANL